MNNSSSCAMVKVQDSKYAIAATAIVVATAVIVGKRRQGSSSKDDTTASVLEAWESHVSKHGSLQEIWPGTLFVLEAEGCSWGPPVRNMTIYRVPDGSYRLVIFNGIAVDTTTLKEIENLGTPSVLVVPNSYHRCCAAVWKARFPEMMVVCPRVAQERVSDIVPVDATTQTWMTMKDWSKWIHALEIDGCGEFETILELELENKANGKKAMLVCDLLFTLPYKENAGYAERFLEWLFDSSISLPTDGSIVVPKVARLSRVFAVKDWARAEQWYRSYARDQENSIAVIAVGHGGPVVEVNSSDGCSRALDGVADQLTKPLW